MELTEKERLKIYKKLLKGYKSKYYFFKLLKTKISTSCGFCLALSSLNKKYKLELFPELWIYRSSLAQYKDSKDK